MSHAYIVNGKQLINSYIKLCKLVASGPRLDAIDGNGHGLPS
jgi:hypothetical protein